MDVYCFFILVGVYYFILTATLLSKFESMMQIAKSPLKQSMMTRLFMTLWFVRFNECAICFANWARFVAPETIVCCNVFGCLKVVMVVSFLIDIQIYNKKLNSQYVDRKKCELFQNNWIFQYLTLSFCTFNFTAVVCCPAAAKQQTSKIKNLCFKAKNQQTIQSSIILSALLHLIVVWKTSATDSDHRGFFTTIKRPHRNDEANTEMFDSLNN